MKEAATWYTATRSHGEAHIAESGREDGPGIGGGRGDIDIDLLQNMDHQERLNAQEGRANPTDDDVEYYQWLSEHSGRVEEETPEPPEVKPPEGGNGGNGENDNNGINEFGGVGDVPYGPEEPEGPLKTARLKLEELNEALGLARDKYAEETAKSRKSYLGRFARGNSLVGKMFKKIPGVSRLIEGVNKRFDQDVVKAKENYEKLINMVGPGAKDYLEALGYSEENIEDFDALGQTFQDEWFEDKIVAERHKQSKDATKLSNWWTRNDGWKGKLKKAGLVAAAGLAAGLTAGAATPLIAGGLLAGVAVPTVAGGAAGGSIAVHVNRRRAKSKVAEGEESLTVAEQQSQQDRRVKSDTVNALYESFRPQDIRYQTSATEMRTDQEKLNLRKRIRQAIAVGKLAGLGSGLLPSWLRGDFAMPMPYNKTGANGSGRAAGAHAGGKPSTSTTGNTVTNSQTPNSSVGKTPSTSKTEVQTQTSNTEVDIPKNIIGAGNGQTQELNDMFTQNGINPANPREARNLFKQLTSKYGDNLTNNDTYDLGNGTQGFTTAGNEVLWKPGVAEDAARILAEMRSGN